MMKKIFYQRIVQLVVIRERLLHLAVIVLQFRIQQLYLVRFFTMVLVSHETNDKQQKERHNGKKKPLTKRYVTRIR